MTIEEKAEVEELKALNQKMMKAFAEIMNCGTLEIEALFDSKNNINVGKIVGNYIEENGSFPNLNEIYTEVMYEFATKHELKIGKDVDIYANGLDTDIYVRENLDKDIVREMENLFNMKAGELNY